MTDMCVIVPTRGRPANAKRLIDDWIATEAKAVLRFAIDDDDPCKRQYIDVFDANPHPWLQFVVGPRLRMAPTLNKEAIEQAEIFGSIGFLGDDHSPRTLRWDESLGGALAGMPVGVVYGNDLFQSQNMPTAVFMTSNLIRSLGYITPPGMTHLWLEQPWLAWGRGTTLRYFPDVIIEHLHPQANGKGEWDAGYIECNSAEIWEHDENLWHIYEAEQLPADLERLRTLL